MRSPRRDLLKVVKFLPEALASSSQHERVAGGRA